MSTKYNLLLSMGECPEAPKDLYDQTCEIYEGLGLLGRRHINHYGKIFSGYDDGCEVVRVGKMHVFSRKSCDNFTVGEILEKSELTTSGFDEAGMEANEAGRSIFSILARFEPVIKILPWNMYWQFPFIDSMEISTPLGRQGLCAYTEDNIDQGTMMFWKPVRERSFYCMDVFKEYLYTAANLSLNIRAGEIGEKKKPIGLKESRRRRNLDKMRKLYDQFTRNPNAIHRIPRFVKTMGDLDLDDLTQ